MVDEAPARSARVDKHGNPLPETGVGCGCQICADAHAERARRAGLMAAARRRMTDLLGKLTSGRRRQAA